MKIRLDKFISSQTAYSRSEIKTLIKNKSVSVNGAAAKSSDIKIDTETDTVILGGREIRYREHVYYMLNKPQGVVSATEDREEKTVLDLLPEEMKRPGLFPAGRLDKDTTGLLIITDDGGFAHRMLSPKKHVYKYYAAVLDKEPDENIKAAFAEGIVLSDGTLCAPADILSIASNTVTLRLKEGKYHQVKRMFAALGCTVIALERYRIGALTLDDSLKKGEIRELTEPELALIFQE
ncbi:MAG: rRNA pseudouridine synthase [Ruminococcus sp.]|nr:rRNA pseudouridine synthase [Ruminococcus sp.]